MRLSTFSAALLAGTAAFASPSLAAIVDVYPGQNVEAKIRGARDGDTVRLHEGEYSAFAIRRSNIRVESAVPGKAHIIATGRNQPAIGAYGQSNIAVVGFRLTSRQGDGVKIGGSAGSPVRNIEFRNNVTEWARLDGFKFFQASGVNMEGNVVRMAGGGGRAGSAGNGNGDGGIDWVQVTNSRMTNNQVVATNGWACAMVKNGSSGNTITGNRFTGCEVNGIDFDAPSSGRAAAANRSGMSAFNNTVNNNTIAAGSGCAIRLPDNTRGNSISGNTIQGRNCGNASGGSGGGTGNGSNSGNSNDRSSGSIDSTDYDWVESAIRGLAAQGYNGDQITGVFGQYGYSLTRNLVNGILAGTSSIDDGLAGGLANLVRGDQSGISNYLITRGLGSIFDGGLASSGNATIDTLLRIFTQGGGVRDAVCSSVSMNAVATAGGIVSGIFSGGRATLAAQLAQLVQGGQANYCAGVTNDRIGISNRNESAMIQQMIWMLKGTDWRNEQAAVDGIVSIAQILMSGMQVYDPSSVGDDYGIAYPDVYGDDVTNERIIWESGNMLERQREVQISAQRQQASSATAIQERPARVAEIMASTRAAPGMTAAIQEQVKMSALQVEAISALHSDIIATERAKVSEMARQQQDRALEKRAFENAMAGWGDCPRCGNAQVGWEK